MPELYPDVPASVNQQLAADITAMYRADTNGYRTEWARMTQIYRDAWWYYSGDALDQRMQNDSGDPGPLLYPLKINLVKQACNMHAFYTWGSYQRNGLIKFNVLPKRRQSKTGNDLNAPVQRAQDVADFHDELFRSTAAISLLREQMRLYNAFGGVWLKIGKDEEVPLGVSLMGVPTRYVYPVWNPADYTDILRAWVWYNMDAYVAKELYGFQGSKEGKVIYREVWTKDQYAVTIDGQVATDPKTGKPMAGPSHMKDPVTGKGYVPLVYVPRLRAGRFYGDSLAYELMGLQDEYNARLADTGDAVTQNTHPQVWGHDLTRRKTRGPLRLTLGEIFDAGETAPGGQEPTLGVLPPPKVETGIMEFNQYLLQQAHQMANLSPVMFGEDEGSQRSALTLAMRALATTSLIDDYRTSWAEALKTIGTIATIISYNENTNGVDEQWFGHEINVEYAPVLPKDREALVAEVVNLTAAGRLSLKRAIEMLPDVPDIEQEIKEILADQKRQQQEQIDLQRKTTEINAKVQAEQAKGQIGVQQQQLALNEKQHQQEMRHGAEKHEQQIGQMTEKHQTQMKIQQEREKAKGN